LCIYPVIEVIMYPPYSLRRVTIIKDIQKTGKVQWT
jgi:hypothetical protein